MSAATDVPFFKSYFRNLSMGLIDLEMKRPHRLTVSYADGMVVRSLTPEAASERHRWNRCRYSSVR